jgi:hypothetical protein
MAEKFSADCHSCLYMEASAKGNINVAECFTSVVRRGEQLGVVRVFRVFGFGAKGVEGGEWEWERGLLWGAICYGVGE